VRSSFLRPVLEAPPAARDDALVQSASVPRLADAGALLERTGALSQLHDCAREAADTHRGRLALVYGEAGIGKTSLLRQFRAALPRRFTVLCGACDPLFTPRPLGPLLEPAGELGGEAAALVAGEARPYEVAGAMLAGLRGFAPCVLVLEDLQWSDEATLDVIRLLARQVESVATLVVLSFRDDCLHRTHPFGVVLGELPPHAVGARVELAGLSREAVEQLASGTPFEVDELHSRTGGNPFYLTEVLAAGSAAVPATVREAVLARIARLSASARDLLDAVAVVPQRTEVWLLEGMCDGDLRALDECLHSGVLRSEADGVVFRHELARLAVEEAMPPNRAVALHRRALAALSANELGADLARLAHHAEAAGDAAAVLRWAPAAGEQAAALGAPREAERQYMRALRFAARLSAEQRAHLQERFSEHAYLGDQRAEAAEALTEAIATYRRAGDLVHEGDALRRRARLLSCIGRYPEAVADVGEAVGVLERTQPGPELARARSAYAAIWINDDLAEASVQAERAVAVASEVGDTEALVHSLNTLGAARMMLGDEQANVHLERSLELALEHRLVIDAGRAFINLSCSLGYAFRWREALRVAEVGIEYSREHGLEAWLRCLTATRGQAELALGRWEAAAETAVGLLSTPNDPIVGVRFDALVVLGLVRARRGDPDYRAMLDEARTIAADGGELALAAQAAIARAEAAWLEGRGDTVAAETDEVYAKLERPGFSAYAGELAVWRRRAGISEEPPTGQLAEHHRHVLSGDGLAAARILRARGCRYAAALALIDSGDAVALREALDELRALGAAPVAAKAARRLRELGERAIPRGPRPRTQANARSLTPRELDVLGLLAEGLRNTEIAERLVISPKTVDHHVSAILRKLDVRTRGQAGAAATRLGLLES
jgi:DNA-binding CsgD family transcriptional regulator